MLHFYRVPEDGASLIGGALVGAQTQSVAPVGAAAPAVSDDLAAESAAARAVAVAKAAAMAPSPNGSDTPGPISMDFTAAARNLFKAAEAVANACASGNGQNSVPQQPPGVTPASNSSSSTSIATTTTTSVTGNIEAPVPKCMVCLLIF